MNLLHYNPEHLPRYVAANNIIGLALDRLPNGRVMACEVRKDEAGVLRTPLAEMNVNDFYLLASRMGVEIVDSRIASAEQIQAHYLQTQRQGGRDQFNDNSLPAESMVPKRWTQEE